MKKIIGTITATIVATTTAMAIDAPANHIVDAAWLKTHMSEVVIVDMRKKGYDEGHIKGAVHWSKKDFREGRYYSKTTKKPIPGYIASPLTFQRTMKKSGINNDSLVIFYAGGTKSKDFRDGALADLTCEFYGFNNVAVLDGGFAGWKKSGGEVGADKARPAKGNFSFEGRKFNQNIVATGEDIDEAVWTGSYQTVDANGKGKHWDGVEGIDPRRLKEGHLPNAKAMHTKVLAVEKDGAWYIGDKAHASKAFQTAGVDAAKPIIWYCNTGHLIAGNWFVSKYILGMKDTDNRVYNGSMADYTRWPKRKLVKGDK